MYRTPKITIPNAQIDGQVVTGVFKFPNNVEYEIAVESNPIFQSNGPTAKITSVILEYFETGEPDLGEGLRQTLSLDLGMGKHTFSIDFSTFTGSPHQWGNTGNGGSVTDATGEDVHAQAAVFDKYLNTARLDSTNPAVLEIGEYSQEGRYGPVNVVPRNPNTRFSSLEQSSTIDGSVDWVEVQALDQQPTDQPNR